MASMIARSVERHVNRSLKLSYKAGNGMRRQGEDEMRDETLNDPQHRRYSTRGYFTGRPHIFFGPTVIWHIYLGRKASRTPKKSRTLISVNRWDGRDGNFECFGWQL